MSEAKKTRYPGVQFLGEGQYRVRVTWKCPKTGMRKNTTRVCAASSPAEANAFKLDVLAELESGNTTRKRIRVADYAHSWMRTKLATLKASTAKRYASTLDLHILPTFGPMFVDAIEHVDVIAWRDEQSGEAKPDTVNRWLRVLRTMFKDAVAEVKLAHDPVARVRALPSLGPDDDPNCLTGPELLLLLQAIQQTDRDRLDRALKWRARRKQAPESKLPAPRYPLFLLLAHTGMRVGEATALRWEDIDEQRMLIHIRRAQWRGRLGTTKTRHRRTVPLTPELSATLTEHRKYLIATQAPGLAAGWIFPSQRTGGLMSITALRKPLLAALKAANIDQRFTVHGFRRTFNNLLRQATTGEVVRSMTGHVTERMTEHYSHIEASEKLHAVLQALVRPAN